MRGGERFVRELGARLRVGLDVARDRTAVCGSRSDTTTFTNVLQSDVVTSVPSTVGGQTVQTPTVFEDIAQVIMRLAFNDPGTPANPASSTSAN